ncbi:hypothetical protein ABD87_14970 [Lysinibacillus sphaericus]|uniref:hypothetical protein n=1 Tax=Lysinibacillus sphaericus TaxID=1421 RepID=UPI0018CF2BB3|nr:hypothetical protein [Lysinibacillus sphaericus]MBG9730795.1 hypothetical protein [Lysinibacillus sphaericus]
MTNYTTTLLMNDGNFSFDLYTNLFFKANNEEEAMKIASNLESNFDKYLQVFFNKNEKKIMVEIIKNDYFDKVYLDNFIYYDETKGDYLKEVIDGFTLYPVCNPECDVEVNNDEFIELLLRDYSVYLENRKTLTFDSIAYGVKNVGTDLTVYEAIAYEAEYIEIDITKLEGSISEEKLKIVLNNMTVEEIRANSAIVKSLIKQSKIPMYGHFLKDFTASNGMTLKKEDEFFLLREDQDDYIVEMENQPLCVISLPKNLEEEIFVF